jgi:hypothetical protein
LRGAYTLRVRVRVSWQTIADHTDEIKLLKDREKELRDEIRRLDKDILVRGTTTPRHPPTFFACRCVNPIR